MSPLRLGIFIGLLNLLIMVPWGVFHRESYEQFGWYVTFLIIACVGLPVAIKMCK